MRTVPFKTVFEGVARRAGIDVSWDEPQPRGYGRMVEHINKRVRTAWRAWEWPELTLTEERPYRTIWNSTKQFYRSNPATGLPDELFYIPNMSYYVVDGNAVSDPPIGTLPTNTAFFVPLTPVDAFIELDQVCRKPIGEVLGVYKSNPRLNGNAAHGLYFRRSEKGIDIYRAQAPTVFVQYLRVPSRFTSIPKVNRQYVQGELAYDPVSGECYQSLGTNSQPVTDTTYWRVEPMPEFMAEYVKAGAYADHLRESDPPGTEASIAKAYNQRVALAESEARDLLETEMRLLRTQGQRFYYRQTPPHRHYGLPKHGYCLSQTFIGGPVTTLTDVCDPEYDPPSPSIPSLSFEDHPEIASISGLATPKLTSLPTRLRAFGSSVRIVIIVAGDRQQQEWQWLSGPYDVTDPGQAQPDDYDPVTNNGHWEQVG